MREELEHFFETLRRDEDRVDFNAIIGLVVTYVAMEDELSQGERPIQRLTDAWIKRHPEDLEYVDSVYLSWEDSEDCENEPWIPYDLFKKSIMLEPSIAIENHTKLTYEEKMAMGRLQPSLALATYSFDLKLEDVVELFLLFSEEEKNQCLRYIKNERDLRIIALIREWQKTKPPIDERLSILEAEAIRRLVRGDR